ncbi:MAG: hypothetical protein NXI24_15490 [bacterium]|nr:hypothetical protein [bacterium]
MLNHLFFLASACLIGLFANLYLEYFMRRDYENGRIIARETSKNEALLLSIFPATVAARLKTLCVS